MLDMDGTIYLGNELFRETAAFLREIRKNGGRYIFLTNNSSRGKADYVAKLRRLGLPAVEEDFFTSADAAALLLKERWGAGYRQKRLYVLGTESLRCQLRAEGFCVLAEPGRAQEPGRVQEQEPEQAEALLVGYDTELTYAKLETACKLLDAGAEYYATNPDWVCPTEWGFAPDCGAICQMLEHASGRKPYFIGKPQAEMALAAIAMAGRTAAETLLVGDRLYTDIACGLNAGVDTCFVLSGEGTRADIEKYGLQPDYIMQDIGELLAAMRGRGAAAADGGAGEKER